jgi:COMPASS component BRE2
MADETPTQLAPAPPAPSEQEHAPAVPSPLNPAAPARPTSKTPVPAPIQREQREKKESLKKRESNLGTSSTTATSSSNLGKRKANSSRACPSPQRFNIPPVKAQDFEPPKEDIMVSHDPIPFEMPDSDRQLYKPIDLAENKKGYRYHRAIADPLFPHKQYYRSTSPPPHYSRLSFEDADSRMHFATNALITTNEKGWRMVRSNVCAREGTLYYEVKIHRGVPRDGPVEAAQNNPQPHVRFGWARREAPLDAPVGFDGYSYGVTDVRFETMHRSRPGKFFHAKKPGKSKSAKAAAAAPTQVTLAPEDQHVREGDVVGIELQLPSLDLHRKIVSGVYNPAVDVGDGFDRQDPTKPIDPSSDVPDIIRDRIPVPYKGNTYFEILDHVASKPMEIYTDRQTNLNNLNNQLGQSSANKDVVKTPPNPNHEHPSLRTLPHSAMRVYKNGRLIGTAFEGLLAFLPPASVPSKTMGAREGFDDGSVGYFPAVSCFWGGIAEVNFGDGPSGFWCPPAHLTSTTAKQSNGGAASASTTGAGAQDVPMPDASANGVSTTDAGAGAANGSAKKGYNPGRKPRPVGERYKEQIAEDIVWDLVDEADFYVQDNGEVPASGAGVEGKATGKSRGLREEE